MTPSTTLSEPRVLLTIAGLTLGALSWLVFGILRKVLHILAGSQRPPEHLGTRQPYGILCSPGRNYLRSMRRSVGRRDRGRITLGALDTE